MLDKLPPEILTHITYHIVLESGCPPVNLLQSCNAIYGAVSPETNANLYAQVFRTQYDTAAPTRRFTFTDAGSVGGVDTAETSRRISGSGTRQDWLGSRALVAELRNRTRALCRLSRNTSEVSAEDLWVVYLMLLENDGKNITHLVSPLAPGPGADMAKIISSFHLRTLIWKDRYPTEGEAESLAMWIAWFVDEYASRTASTLRALRPYVFAAHVYDLFYAPWTLLDLPYSSSQDEEPLAGPFVVDRVPRTRKCVVPSYGRDLELAIPVLSHAAMLRFFGGPQDLVEPSSASSAAQSEFAFDVPATDLRHLPSPNLVSKAHDADYSRLLACNDAKSSRGRPISAWKGVFHGAWEGTFTFLDFDAFRDMLSGQNGTKAVYTGPYGEQAQVWKLRETFIRPRDRQPRRGLPLRGLMTNAGFPDLRNFAADPISGRAPGTSPEDATIDDALARQMEALEGYERVPESGLPAALAEADEAWASGRDSGLSLLVTGVGHSAWGRFIISGHVRVWDGLVYLVKEYAPYQRGKWVYRGYVLSSDIMVGRWRDTFTSEDYVGYEGTFILNRR